MRVILNRNLLAPGGAKGCYTGVLPLTLGGLLEKFNVLGVAARPASFNVVYTKRIQLFGNPNFVGNRKADALTLAAIPQRGVVNFHRLAHHSAKAERGLYAKGGPVANTNEGGEGAPARLRLNVPAQGLIGPAPAGAEVRSPAN